MKYLILVSEQSSIFIINGIKKNTTIRDIEQQYITGVLSDLLHCAAIDIFKLNIKKPHYIKFELRVIAQEKINDKLG